MIKKINAQKLGSVLILKRKVTMLGDKMKISEDPGSLRDELNLTACPLTGINVWAANEFKKDLN